MPVCSGLQMKPEHLEQTPEEQKEHGNSVYTGQGQEAHWRCEASVLTTKLSCLPLHPNNVLILNFIPTIYLNQ